MTEEYFRGQPYDSGHRSARSRRLLLVAGAVAALVVLGGCAAAVLLPPWLAAQSLDPAINARTGLADGTYVMSATAAFHRDEDCWFRGNPYSSGQPSRESLEVTVYGSGPIQCAGATYGQVVFAVDQGRAVVIKSNP